MPAMKTVNLEEGRPSVASASARLLDQLRLARKQSYAAVKAIHPQPRFATGSAASYESRSRECWRAWHKVEKSGAWVAGEDWRISDETTWRLIQKHRELKQDRDLGKGNEGISIVVL
jgi:hypothetical protein